MRIKNISFLVVVAIMSVAMTSCMFNNRFSVKGNGTEGRDVRHLAPINSIEIDGVEDVYYAQADTTLVLIKTDTNIIPYISTTVDKGCLYISSKNNANLRPTKKISILVYSPSLSSVVSRGVGNLYIPGKLHIDSLDVQLSGVGHVNFLDSLVVGSLSMQVQGVGYIDVAKLKSKDAKVHVQGVGGITIAGVTNYLDSKCEGVGKINTDHLHIVGSGK